LGSCWPSPEGAHPSAQARVHWDQAMCPPKFLGGGAQHSAPPPPCPDANPASLLVGEPDPCPPPLLSPHPGIDSLPVVSGMLAQLSLVRGGKRGWELGPEGSVGGTKGCAPESWGAGQARHQPVPASVVAQMSWVSASPGEAPAFLSGLRRARGRGMGYRGTSLIRKRTPLAPVRRPVSGGVGGS